MTDQILDEPEAPRALTVAEPQPDATPTKPLADLRAHAMMVPAEAMSVALIDYTERRKTFRDWLKEQLVEGVHYGYPPGTEPKYDEAGRLLQKTKQGWKVADPKQWSPRPSLYQSGADFIVDLMGLLPEYESDAVAWQQAGEVKGRFHYICRLRSRATGEVIGEGHGAHGTSDRKDANTAVKMACKSAKVHAVLNAYGLSDLFTQDLEDGAGKPPRHENPEADPSAPKTQPRELRVTTQELTSLMQSFWEQHPECHNLPTKAKRKQAFAGWLETNVLDGAPLAFNPAVTAEWDRKVFNLALEVLNNAD